MILSHSTLFSGLSNELQKSPNASITFSFLIINTLAWYSIINFCHIDNMRYYFLFYNYFFICFFINGRIITTITAHFIAGYVIFAITPAMAFFAHLKYRRMRAKHGVNMPTYFCLKNHIPGFEIAHRGAKIFVFFEILSHNPSTSP